MDKLQILENWIDWEGGDEFSVDRQVLLGPSALRTLTECMGALIGEPARITERPEARDE